MPLLKPSSNVTIDEGNSGADKVHTDKVGERIDSDPPFEQSGPSSKPHFTTQAHLNDLVGNLSLSKIRAENGIFSSRTLKYPPPPATTKKTSNYCEIFRDLVKRATEL